MSKEFDVCTSSQSTAFDLLDTLRNDEPSDGFVDLVSLLGDHPVSSPESYVSNSSPEREEEDDLIETKMFFKNEDNFFDETIINPKTQPTVYPTKVKQEPLRTNFTFAQNHQQSLNTFVSQYVQSQKNQKALPIPNFMNASNPFMNMPTMQMFGTPNFLLNQPIITPTPPIPTVQTAAKEESDARKKLKRRRQTNEINTNTDDPEKQKEIKRQKRLIKNRESAQASRERKKRYLQGLEEKVEELSNNNMTLNNKVRSLEEENRYLREQLQRAMKGEKIEEPVLKKRKVEDTVQQNAKLPLPPANSQTTNGMYSFTQFFNPMNWGGLVPNLGQPGMPWQGSQVVLFVMLICVGLFVFQTGIDVDKGTNFPFEDKKMQSDVVNKRVTSRKLLNYNNTQCSNNEIDMLFSHVEKVVKLISDKDYTEEIKALEQFVGKVSLKWDEKRENLIFSLPLGKNIDETKINNETELYKLFSVSKNTLSDICAKLTEVK